MPENSPTNAPENDRLLRYFEARRRHYNYPAHDPAKVYGTHPDIVDRIWTELGGTLPQDCHAVVYGAPVLRHPSTGIIFAFAGGTHTYAMRLPAGVREAAIQAGATRVYHYRAYPELEIDASTFDLNDIGDEWVFCGWLKGEDDLIKAAYQFAGGNGA